MRKLLFGLVILLDLSITNINITQAKTIDNVAKSYLGTKYKLGGEGHKGFDCSSFVRHVFSKIGIELPRTVLEQFRHGIKVSKVDLDVGDLVFFKKPKGKNPSHVGIYLGDGKFIHASNVKRIIRIDSISDKYFSRTFVGARRVIT
jgi:lipoprotein Spr